MITDPSLMPGLLQCGLLPSTFTGSGEKALRGPCAKCGGKRRMVVFLNRAFLGWFVRCDLCGFEGWAPNVFPGVKWPDGPMEDLPAPEPKDYSRPLSVLASSHIDSVLHDNLTPEMRAEWRKMGVPDDMQDFYNLGFVHGRPFKRTNNDGIMVLDAYTIPKYAPNWEIRNMDFKLIDPPEEEGRYRPFPGAPPAPFLSRPDFLQPMNDDGHVYIVEGAKKAMVTSIFLEYEQVIGVPSANSWAKATELVKDASLVYVLLDPDAWYWSRKMCKEIGSKARHITLPVKIDDAILSDSLSRTTFEQTLRFARREGGVAS